MRTLLLALMIALLPLRGWVGDAMALDMVAEALHTPTDAIKSVATGTHSTGHGDHFEAHHADCTGHAMAAAAPTHDTAGAHGANCASHADCQLCHSVALAPLPLTLAPTALPVAMPPLALAGFVSAEPSRGFKPPIA
jgi:hypothetical protein